jgi:nucleoid DNA-binding protein
MQAINFHLAYLLTKHECVIIPGFGAFIVSPEASYKDKESGIFSRPASVLGFNPDIRHNDGLLANSLSKEKNISYKDATLLINQYVTHLIDRLNTTKSVTINWLGDLSLSPENKILFTPAASLSCNAAYYGFTNLYFPRLTEIRSQEKEINRGIVIPFNRRTVMRVGSVAAAILVLFSISTPLNDSQGPLQNASLFSFVSNAQPVLAEEPVNEETDQPEAILPVSEIIPVAEVITAPEVIAAPETIAVPETKPAPAKEVKPVKANEVYYYIVIASLTSKTAANQKLSDFQASGFDHVAVISKDNHHRICIERFKDKKEAETFLTHFRQDNPKYATSWLLCQRD